MQTLEQAQETNRRLNRRVQQLEGPHQARLAKLQSALDYEQGYSKRCQQRIDELEMHLFSHWVWTIILVALLTAFVVWR